MRCCINANGGESPQTSSLPSGCKGCGDGYRPTPVRRPRGRKRGPVPPAHLYPASLAHPARVLAWSFWYVNWSLSSRNFLGRMSLCICFPSAAWPPPGYRWRCRQPAGHILAESGGHCLRQRDLTVQNGRLRRPRFRPPQTEPDVRSDLAPSSWSGRIPPTCCAEFS